MPRTRTFVAPALAALGAAALALWAAAEAPVLEPLDVHKRTSLAIVEQLRHNHYVRKSLNDETSSEIFENYLNTLDGARLYFSAADINAIDKYRHRLDDALKRGDLRPAFDIFNRYQQRVVERLEFLLSELDKGVGVFDFTLDEAILLDRSETPWPADAEGVNESWRKRLKSAVLNMKLGDKSDAEIQELLTKRYGNRLKQALQTTNEDAFGLYANAFTSVYDPHTRYFSPRTSQNFSINMSLSLQGIGAVLRSEDDYTSVVRLVPAGPAAKSGRIKPSDRIISVGQGKHGPLIDVVGWRLDDVVELIRGPKGSTVRLEVVPDESKEQVRKVVQLMRNTVKLEEQAAQKKLLTLNRDGRSYRLGIVEVPTFYADLKAVREGDSSYRSTATDVERLVRELDAEGIDGLVVDLRNNGGGSLQEADRLTGLFIQSGPTVQVRAKRRQPNVYEDVDDGVVWAGPLAIMVNRLSASASEIFAGAIQDYGRGLIVGGRTFGKGTVQTLVPLNRGQLKLTAAKFYRVSGRSTQHRGILPDIEFPDIYNAEHIGESSLEGAMPWDQIQPAAYRPASNIGPALAYLRNRHAERVAENPDFVYLRRLAERIDRNAAKEELSLNEAQRRREQADGEAWRLDLENALRVAKGEPPLQSLDDLEEEEDLADAPEDRPPADDPMLVEAGQVLLDLIGFGRQVAMLEPGAVEKLTARSVADQVAAELAD